MVHIRSENQLNELTVYVHKQLEVANRPTTFLSIMRNVVVTLGSAGGLLAILRSLFENHGK